VHASQAEVAALREQLREREVQRLLLARTADAEQRYVRVYTMQCRINSAVSGGDVLPSLKQTVMPLTLTISTPHCTYTLL
jgi:hypothetical protein